MKIRNVELEDLDFLDADVVENCENALEKFNELASKEVKFQKSSEMIRYQCEVVFNFIDELFGEGAAYEVFEGKCNLKDCVEVAAEVVEKITKSIKSQRTDLNKSLGQYSINRADRRNNTYKQKKPYYNRSKGK